MKVILCMDSWKGSLTALKACTSVADGFQTVFPSAEMVMCPMADGGEGTLDLMALTRPGERRRLQVTGPFLDRRVDAEWLWWPEDHSALVEMAVCAGLPLLKPSERNPMRTTTRGVGELLGEAARSGADHVTLAAGGSATVDGGTGMAAALGWRFLDARGNVLPDGGGALRDLHVIEAPPNRFSPRVRVMCDVTNPLLGEAGAAKIFGPQKGATPDQVHMLEEGLGVLAERIRMDVEVEVTEVSGGGAAGGIAAGAIAFLGAELVSGVDEILRLGRVEQQIKDADLVVTGEGRLDTQSLDGKVVSGVLALAARHQVPVAVVAGDCALDPGVASARGIRYALSANDRGLPVEEAMSRAAELARNAGVRLAECMQS